MKEKDHVTLNVFNSDCFIVCTCSTCIPCPIREGSCPNGYGEKTESQGIVGVMQSGTSYSVLCSFFIKLSDFDLFNISMNYIDPFATLTLLNVFLFCGSPC